ncbi:flagellar hook-length control protein FliK [Thalassotalea euphylliae]|uniref:flagellar hook-length control protein FliK n=1 Tax=Thalassotalea euphylliae TaxID=1655234 RepID=UPI0036405C3F
MSQVTLLSLDIVSNAEIAVDSTGVDAAGTDAAGGDQKSFAKLVDDQIKKSPSKGTEDKKTATEESTVEDSEDLSAIKQVVDKVNQAKGADAIETETSDHSDTDELNPKHVDAQSESRLEGEEVSLIDKEHLKFIHLLDKSQHVLSTESAGSAETVQRQDRVSANKEGVVGIADDKRVDMTLLKNVQAKNTESAAQPSHEAIINKNSSPSLEASGDIKVRADSVDKVTKQNVLEQSINLQPKGLDPVKSDTLEKTVQRETSQLPGESKALALDTSKLQNTTQGDDISKRVMPVSEKAKAEVGANSLQANSEDSGELETSDEALVEVVASSVRAKSETAKPVVFKTDSSPGKEISLQATNVKHENLPAKGPELSDVTDSGEVELVTQAPQVQPNNSKPVQVNVSTQSAVEADPISQQELTDHEQQSFEQGAEQQLVENKPSEQQQVKAAHNLFAERLTSASGQQSMQTEREVDDASVTQLEEVAAQVVERNVAVKKQQFVQTETINIFRKDFANAVKEKVMVMVSQKLQQVDIQLDPPELGNVHVRLNLQGEQAAVSFTVQNQQAKEAFEQQMGKLRDMLSESGVDVGDANVSQQGEGREGGQMANRQNRGQQEDVVSQQLHVSQLINPSATGIDFYA